MKKQILIYRQTRKRWNLDTGDLVGKSYVYSFDPISDERYQVEGTYPVCDNKPYHPFPFGSLAKIVKPGRCKSVPCTFGVDHSGGTMPTVIDMPEGAVIVRNNAPAPPYVEWKGSLLKCNLGPITILHADDVWQLAGEDLGFRFAGANDVENRGLDNPVGRDREQPSASLEDLRDRGSAPDATQTSRDHAVAAAGDRGRRELRPVDSDSSLITSVQENNDVTCWLSDHAEADRVQGLSGSLDRDESRNAANLSGREGLITDLSDVGSRDGEHDPSEGIRNGRDSGDDGSCSDDVRTFPQVLRPADRRVPFFIAEWRVTHLGVCKVGAKSSLSQIVAETYVGTLGSMHTIEAAPVATHWLTLTDGWESTGKGLVRSIDGQVERIPDSSILVEIRTGRLPFSLESIVTVLAEELPGSPALPASEPESEPPSINPYDADRLPSVPRRKKRTQEAPGQLLLF